MTCDHPHRPDSALAPPVGGEIRLDVRDLEIRIGAAGPDVVSGISFEVPAGDTSRTRRDYERHLKAGPPIEERIQEAVDSCPVEVIRADRG